MTHAPHINALIADIGFFDSWEEKYEYIIGMGKKLPPMADALKTDSTKVEGCMSQVWILATKNPDNTMSFIADSDAILVRGIIALLLEIYNNQPIDIIKNTNIQEVMREIGLDKNLAGSRRNGLSSMINRIKISAK